MRPLPTHPRQWLAFAAVVAALAGSAAGQNAPTRSPAPKPAVDRPKRAPIEFLPDSFVLAKVGDHTIRAIEFVRHYYSSYAEFRPRPDSAGRAEFLQTMIDKEVLAGVARKAKRAESFEDRAIMKAYTQRVLGNVLYQRSVADSVSITEADVETTLAQMKRELRVQRMRFGTRQTAERVRADLVANRMSWSRAASLRVRTPQDTSQSGDLGWRTRPGVPPLLAPMIFALPVGGLSQVVVEPPSYALYRVADERPSRLPILPATRKNVRDELVSRRTEELNERMIAGIRARMGMSFDSVNVAWAAARFPTKVQASGGSNIVLDVSVPEIAAEDTGRVLATYRGGQVTVEQLLDSYRQTSELQRPSLESQPAIRAQVDGLVLEPLMADVARGRGLDRDSLAVALIDKRHEELLVDHLYQDSIMSKVFIPPAARRKYYKDNQHRFFTSGSARYAVFDTDEKDDADSLVAKLKRGVIAEEIIRQDSLPPLRMRRGRVRTLSRDDHGASFYRRVFEEMTPGQVELDGPDAGGGYLVIQLIERDEGRQVGFEEADQQIDEYLQQGAAEKLLTAFIARHKRGLKIVSRPELVMRIRLTNPDWR